MRQIPEQFSYLPAAMNMIGNGLFIAAVIALVINIFVHNLSDNQLHYLFFYAIGFWFGKLRWLQPKSEKN